MILGTVDAFKQAVIILEVNGPTGTWETISAVIDTGFSGSLTVTPDLASRLQLTFREIRSYELGSGDLVDFAIHDVVVLWDGRLQNVSALVTEGGTLVGMTLIAGHTLFIDAVDGGIVRISPRT